LQFTDDAGIGVNIAGAVTAATVNTTFGNYTLARTAAETWVTGTLAGILVTLSVTVAEAIIGTKQKHNKKIIKNRSSNQRVFTQVFHGQSSKKNGMETRVECSDLEF
jgi:hypothetical protein